MKIRHWILGGVLACSLVYAVEAAKASKNDSSRVEEKMDNLSITSDNCEYDVEKRIVTFDGHVVAITSEMQLTAKKMLVYLDADNKLNNIEALHNVNVRVFKTQESAIGDKGFYDAKQDVLTLLGNCVLRRDGYTATGPKAVYDRRTSHFKLAGASLSIPFKKNSDTMDAMAPSKGKK